MHKLRLKIAYCLEFKSAFHCGTGLPNGLIDRAVTRDEGGFLYIPGSTVKGVLRDRCEQILGLFDLSAHEPHSDMSGLYEAHPHPTLIATIFGSRFQPGQLYFDDAVMDGSQQVWFDSPSSQPDVKEEKRHEYRARQVETRTQVSISRLTGTAQMGALYHSEYGMYGLKFAGEIKGVLMGTPLMGAPQWNFPLLVLVAGLLSLDRIGGNKSTGAGEVICTISAILGDDTPVILDDLLAELPYLDREMYTELEQEPAR